METATITLRIGRAGESATAHPTGNATGPTGARRDFAGWLGLVSAIDELLTGAPVDDPVERGDDA